MKAIIKSENLISDKNAHLECESYLQELFCMTCDGWCFIVWKCYAKYFHGQILK